MSQPPLTRSRTARRCPLVHVSDAILVLTRALNEQAFFASFAQWYSSLGVSCFVVLRAGKALPPGLAANLARRVVDVEVPDSSFLEAHAIKKYGHVVLQQARRGYEWYLHVDVDELLVLAPPVRTLHQYIRGHQERAGSIDVFQWPWAKVRHLHASCGAGRAAGGTSLARLLQTASAVADLNVKSLARLASTSYVNGPHFPLLRRNLTRPWRLHHPTIGVFEAARAHRWTAFGFTRCPTAAAPNARGGGVRPVRIREATRGARRCSNMPLEGAAVECTETPREAARRRETRCPDVPTAGAGAKEGRRSCTVDGPSARVYADAALVHVTVRSVRRAPSHPPHPRRSRGVRPRRHATQPRRGLTAFDSVPLWRACARYVRDGRATGGRRGAQAAAAEHEGVGHAGPSSTGQPARLRRARWQPICR